MGAQIAQGSRQVLRGLRVGDGAEEANDRVVFAPEIARAGLSQDQIQPR